MGPADRRSRLWLRQGLAAESGAAASIGGAESAGATHPGGHLTQEHDWAGAWGRGGRPAGGNGGDGEPGDRRRHRYRPHPRCAGDGAGGAHDRRRRAPGAARATELARRSATLTAMAVAYIGLGANLGDRLATLRTAVQRLRTFGRVTAVSSLYETEPVGYRAQPRFLNAVVALETALLPADLLRAL